jgi:hypothetical protein
MPSVDLSEFEAHTGSSSGPICAVSKVLAELPEPRAEALAAALEGDQYGHATIARTVAGWGLRMSPTTIGHHRRGECRCGQ